MVSVPYRGAIFLNSAENIVCYKRKEMFPSPIGELYFSIIKKAEEVQPKISFRPLSGSYISQYHLLDPACFLGVFAVLRGKLFFLEI